MAASISVAADGDPSQLGNNLGVPDVADNDASRIAYMNTQKHAITNLTTRLKKDKEPLLNTLDNLDMFLAWLKTSLEMTPKIKAETNIDSVLKLIVNPDNKYGENYVTQATILLGKWESEEYGKGLLVEDEEEAETPAQSVASASSAPNIETATVSIRVPPQAHPIYGRNGIMFGVVVVKTSKTTTYRLDTRYSAKDCKVFGHNDIVPGTWWPMQIVALFHGAHGSRMGGIAGSEQGGAYSIVLSGKYDDLDRDEGETIYYSGSRSHENTNPNHPGDSTTYTRALKRSMQTRKPVRVLRAASSKNPYAPSVGIRYDGLYEVVALSNPINPNGGMYERFKLVRQNGGQPSLGSFTSPTSQQSHDYSHVKDGY